MTRTVRDAAIMLRAMAGYDPKDSTSVKAPVPDYEAAMTGDIKGMKIGIPRAYRVEGMSAEIDALSQQGVKWLAAACAAAVEITLPPTRHALPHYSILPPGEDSPNQ